MEIVFHRHYAELLFHEHSPRTGTSGNEVNKYGNDLYVFREFHIQRTVHRDIFL
jgi:hypothetical protein